MRAVVVERYGAPEVARVADVPTPSPSRGQVLVRVVAAAVTSGDARIRGARFPKGFAPVARLMFGIRKPRNPVLGGFFSGVVAAVGEGVSGLAPGDPVAGTTGRRLGAHAEYVAVDADRLVRRPTGVSADDAAALLFGGTTALFFLRDKAAVRPGQSVLVNGASGAVGTSAVQLARNVGASVTGVTSGRNAALVKELGADSVLDYTVTDLSEVQETFDVVFDTVGNISPATGRRLLAEGGVLLLAVADLRQVVSARGNVKAGSAPERAEDVATLLDLAATGQLRAVVDRTGSLDDVVDLYRRVDSGHKVGSVLLHP